jgi:hypothetical protein
MDNFIEYIAFWSAAAGVYYATKVAEEAIKELRAKYILWAWKRRK